MIQRQVTPEDVIAILRRRWPLLLILAVVGAGIGWEVARVLPKRFTSQTVVLVESPTVPGDYVKSIISEDINQRLSSMQHEILSRSRLEPVIKQLYGSDIDQVKLGGLITSVQSSIAVYPLAAMADTSRGGLPGFIVEVTNGDAQLAQKICSTITSMFMEENAHGRQQHAEQTADFLAKQLDGAKAKLDEQDARMAQFKRRYLGTLPDEQQTNLNVLTGLTSQLDAATQTLSRTQQNKSFTESVLAQQLAAWQASQNGRNPDTLELQLTGLQAQLIALRSKYTDDYPDVIKVKRDIANVQAKLAASGEQIPTAQTGLPSKPLAEPPQIQSLRAQIHQQELDIKDRTAQQDEIERQIKLYQSRVQSSPAIEQEYKAITRDYQTALEFYNELLRKRDESGMASDLERRQEGEQFQILDAASLPSEPSFPKRSRFILGGSAGGLALGLAFCFLMELKDTSLRKERDVEALLHLPVLVMIPVIKAASDKNPTPSPSSLGIAMRT